MPAHVLVHRILFQTRASLQKLASWCFHVNIHVYTYCTGVLKVQTGPSCFMGGTSTVSFLHTSPLKQNRTAHSWKEISVNKKNCPSKSQCNTTSCPTDITSLPYMNTTKTLASYFLAPSQNQEVKLFSESTTEKLSWSLFARHTPCLHMGGGGHTTKGEDCAWCSTTQFWPKKDLPTEECAIITACCGRRYGRKRKRERRQAMFNVLSFQAEELLSHC